MSDREVKALLEAERADSLGAQGVGSSKLTAERAKAMDYYLGDVSEDMPSMEGRSKAVSSDVADTVEGLMPALMDIFVSTDEVVRFEPVGEEDEDAAQQETDYVNHVFMQKNPGFLVLYSFVKDALLSKVGVVKVFWDETEARERETYHDLEDDAFAAMAADPAVRITAHSERLDPANAEGRLHDVTLERSREYKCARVEAVPPEEFGISSRARSIRDSKYCFHERRDRTESELIDAGYDAAQIRKLPSAGVAINQEERARDTAGESESNADAKNTASRAIIVTEHYCVFDYEGKGEANLYRVTTGGDETEILTRGGKPDIVMVDAMPFAAMTPVIMTHRFFGRSIADLVMDIQRIKTSLLRALLDNAYLANNQRVEVAESHAHERTLDDLLVNRPGGIVRTKTPGGLVPIPNQPIGNFAFPLIEYWDSVREWRTGVSRQGQGLDSRVLQNQTATAVAQTMSAAQARMKLIARIFAETGVRDMFSLLHACIRKNDRKINTVKLRNKWVPVDPRAWRTRDDMTINVGLGDGSRDQQVAHLMMVLGLQKEAIMQPQLGLVTPENIYNTATKLVERIGLKTVQPYFSDPKTNPMAGQAPPDPKMEEIKGKLEVEQVRAQADAAASMQKMEMEAALKREQMAAEFQLRREQMAAEMELKREEMVLKARLGAFGPPGDSSINGVRMGGEVG